jgi:hypothetical protein
MALVIKGSTSGQVTIDVPAEAGTNTLTLPASTGEITVGKNTPYFSVDVGSDQTGIGDAVTTKVAFDTVEVESGVSFDTTNNRFTVPSGADGKYYVSASVQVRTESNSDLQACNIYIYRNGASQLSNQWNFTSNYIRLYTMNISKILSLTEGQYVEIYAQINTVNGGSTRLFQDTSSNFSVYKLIE